MTHRDDSDELLAGVMHQSTGDRMNQVVPIAAKKSKKSRRIKWHLFVVLLCIAVLIGLGLAYVTQRDSISELLAPSPPFTQDLIDRSSYPLYFPTELPATMQLETESITEPEVGIVIYRISNDTGSRTVTVTLQAISSNVNYDKLFKPEVKVQEHTLSTGRALIGTNEDGLIVAHLLTSKTWVIIQTTRSNISSQEILDIFKTMRATSPSES